MLAFAFLQLWISIWVVPVGAVLPLHIQGHRFIKPASPDNDPLKNEVFFIKGIDYQPGGSSAFDSYGTSDVLSDPSICTRDIYAFQRLGINTVRIYQLNPDLNHDECMTMLNNAGIYVVLDVNSGNFGEHLNRADPSGSYNSRYLERVFKFIESFKNYPNVLGFFCGNEVINDDANYAEINPPFLRALQRDMKQYISRHSDRMIPVGYAAADNIALRLATFKYLECNSWDGNSISPELEASKSDFYGLNNYQWCSGTSNWDTSGYQELAQSFSDAKIPLLFSEYGANQNSPRIFDEVSEGLYGGLKDTFSGGLVYEFSEEPNGYGVARINVDDNSLTFKQDFENLAYQFARLNLPQTKQSELSNPSVSKCDAAEINAISREFGVKNFWIPSQPPEVTSMIEYGVSGMSSGSIIDGYSNPERSVYGIKDTNNNPIDAILTWEENNKINELDKNLLALESTSSSFSVSYSSSSPLPTSSTSTSSISTSVPISLSPSMIVSKKNPSANVSNSSSKSSKASFSSSRKAASSSRLHTGTSTITSSDVRKNKAHAVIVQTKIGTIIKLATFLLLSVI